MCALPAQAHALAATRGKSAGLKAAAAFAADFGERAALADSG